MAAHNDLGHWGEDLAVAYLVGLGYDVVQRDWRVGHRDIDIIARTPDLATLVFVEVKTRTDDVVTRPSDAINKAKIKNIAIAANAYVKEFQIWDELRFDIISVVGTDKEHAEIEHIADAFNPLLV